MWVANTGFGYGAVGRRCPVRAAHGALRQVPRRSQHHQRRRRPGQGQAGVLRIARACTARTTRRRYSRSCSTASPCSASRRSSAGPASPSAARVAAVRRTRLIEWLDAARLARAGCPPRPPSPIPRSTHAARSPTGATAYTVDGETLVLNGYPIATEDEHQCHVNRAGVHRPRRHARIDGDQPGARGCAADRPGDGRPSAAVSVLCSRRRSCSRPRSRPVGGTTQNQRLVVFPGQFSDLDPDPGRRPPVPPAPDQITARSPSTTADSPRLLGDVTQPFIQESTASAGLLGTTPGVVLFRVKALDAAPAWPTPAHQRASSVSWSSTTKPRRSSIPLIRGRPSNCTRTPMAPGSARWSPRDTDGRYFIQAVDGAGNTGQSANSRATSTGPTAPRRRPSPSSPTAPSRRHAGTSRPMLVGLYVAGVPATVRQRLHLLVRRHLPGFLLVPVRRPPGTTSITFSPPSASAAPRRRRSSSARTRWRRRRPWHRRSA